MSKVLHISANRTISVEPMYGYREDDPITYEILDRDTYKDRIVYLSDGFDSEYSAEEHGNEYIKSLGLTSDGT